MDGYIYGTKTNISTIYHIHNVSKALLVLQLLLLHH
jgi:hypothetical protein